MATITGGSMERDKVVIFVCCGALGHLKALGHAKPEGVRYVRCKFPSDCPKVDSRDKYYGCVFGNFLIKIYND